MHKLYEKVLAKKTILPNEQTNDGFITSALHYRKSHGRQHINRKKMTISTEK